MQVISKPLHMQKVTQGQDDPSLSMVEPAFYGGGKASLTLYRVLDKDGKESDEALLQVSQAGKLVLVRKKSV